MFALSIFLLVLTIAALCVRICYKKRNYTKGSFNPAPIAGYITIGLALATVVSCLAAMIYTQDPGQASVLVSFTGQVEGINYDTGLHFKTPWSHRVIYDIRNNTLSYVGENGNTSDHAGGNVTGAQITFQDASGVTGNIDLVVRYSIRGESVDSIYNEYKTQAEFVNATLAQDVRAETRSVLSGYETLQVYSNREAVKGALLEKLSANWEKLGVDIEDIYLQEIRYSNEVKSAFDAAQTARTRVETAKAEQEQAKIEAETNNIKSAALSDAILREKLIDAIKNGNGTYIIDTDNISIGTR
jgi:regulator of protease activity HflC (stomatin/prohibitin superfamily)